MGMFRNRSGHPTMKKPLLIIVVALFAIVLVAYIAVQFFFGSIVKTGVNQVGPRVTQTSVTLEDASLSPLSGEGTLTGFTVGNPAGWSQANLLHVGRVQFDVEPGSVFSDTIVINSLVVEQPEFVYETRVVASNIGDLLKNIEAAVGTRPDTTEQDAKPRKFIVRHFSMQNAKVAVGVGPAAMPMVVPAVELRDLGVNEGGLTAGQLGVAVMREVLPEIVAAATNAAGNLGGALDPGTAESIKKAGEGLQKILGGGKK